jgi:hypothetical protein
MNPIDELLAHHIVTPSQYYDSRRRSATDDALQRLMLAVMVDALECMSYRGLGNGSAAGRKAAMEADRWIEEENDDYPFSFNSICDVLGIDAQSLRKAVGAWLASGRRLSRRAPVTQQAIRLRARDGDCGRWRKREGKSYSHRDLADDALHGNDRSLIR